LTTTPQHAQQGDTSGVSISHQSSDLVKVKAKLAPALSIYYDGSLSDNDEMRGEELEVEINSPPKGKR